MKTVNVLIPESLQGTKEAYEAPVIEIVKVKVEYGFSSSTPAGPDECDSDCGDDPPTF